MNKSISLIAACITAGVVTACGGGSGGGGSGADAPKMSALAKASALQAGAIYTLTNPNSGKALQPKGGATASGTPIEIATLNGTKNQQWKLTLNEQGSYTLVSEASGNALDVVNAGTSDRTPVSIYTPNRTVAQQWQVNPNSDGTFTLVNPNSNKVLDVDGAGTASGTAVQIYTSNNTAAQKWSLNQVSTTNPPGLPARIVGGYYPNWTPSPVRIRDVHPNYNLIYLFSAYAPGGNTSGRVTFTAPGDGRGAATNLNADIAHARTVQGRRIILSVGGAGHGMGFPNRATSQAFVNSIAAIYQQLGGFDGMDWNTFEADQAPDTDEMIWISLELKKRYPGFIISAPPAPWNQRDKTFCQKMVQAGAMDYAAPQYYDGPDLATQAYVVANLRQWVDLIGADHLVVGFGVKNNVANYMSAAQAVSTWQELKANHPSLRGGFNWEIHTDESMGWPFATNLKPLINP